MSMLRDYQAKSIEMLYEWFRVNKTGNVCVSMPTGSGKSHVIAAFCKDVAQRWPTTRILMLVHSKELIEQNAEKMLQHWPEAPLGIFSASVGRRELGDQITFAGIQSVRNRAKELGHYDICIVDEAHAISHREEGGYRKLLAGLAEINPRLRIIGYSATPYRLGHGMITDKPAVFDDLIEPISIQELVRLGYLSTLRSKATTRKLDATGVRKSGGEYVGGDLQRAIDTDENNMAMVKEVIERAEGRKSWMFFCTGVQHAEHVRDILTTYGITALSVTGDMPKAERESAIAGFKSGRVTALTTVNCLSTGFDHEGIDLIVMARPTLSPGLYLQSVGRGMRISEGKADCLVLDFAGNIARHGPVTDVVPPQKKGDGTGEAPIKVCEGCGEICHLSVKECPCCGMRFPVSEKPRLVLETELCVMGSSAITKQVKTWIWRVHCSRATGKDLLKVTYYSGLSQLPLTEYFSIMHDGYAGDRARRELMKVARACGVTVTGHESLIQLVGIMNQGKAPAQVEYKKNGKYDQVVRRIW